MGKVSICISLKDTVADPQGMTVKHALQSLGYGGIKNVRVGKYVELEAEKSDEGTIHKMCKELLVNPVIEKYRIEMK